jgi:hypothetical protein
MWVSMGLFPDARLAERLAVGVDRESGAHRRPGFLYARRLRSDDE